MKHHQQRQGPLQAWPVQRSVRQPWGPAGGRTGHYQPAEGFASLAGLQGAGYVPGSQRRAVSAVGGPQVAGHVPLSQCLSQWRLWSGERQK